MMQVEKSLPEPLNYSPGDAARVAGVGRNAIYLAIGSGALTARKFGRRTLIARDDLIAWLSALPTIKAKQAA